MISVGVGDDIATLDQSSRLDMHVKSVVNGEETHVEMHKIACTQCECPTLETRKTQTELKQNKRLQTNKIKVHAFNKCVQTIPTETEDATQT